MKNYTVEEINLAKKEMMEKVDKNLFYHILEYAMHNYFNFDSDKKPTTEWLKNWADNKVYLYLLFGRQLSIEQPVETQIERNDGIVLINGFCDEKLSERKYMIVSDILKTITRSKRQNRVYNNTYGANKTYSFDRYIDLNDIIKNLLPFDIEIYGKTYRKGTKVNTLLKDFVKESDKNQFDILYSQLIQSLYASGRAVISINPIDYLTMSENASNWQSCHRLRGEFKAGIVSYMQDKYTTIGYVANKTEVAYEFTGNKTWNSKKWRQVVYINPDENSFVQSRQYPAENRAFDETLFEILTKEVFKDIPMQRQSTKNNDISGTFKGWIKNINFDSGDYLHYNDIIHYNCSRSFVFPADLHIDLMSSIEIGSEVNCICGCKESVRNAGSLWSSNSGHERCDDDDYYEEDDGWNDDDN